MQFFLKYLLVKETGFFPKVHDLEILFKSLGEIYPEVTEFYNKNQDTIWEIHYAYTNSRYGEKEYPKQLVERFLRVLDEFYELIQKWL